MPIYIHMYIYICRHTHTCDMVRGAAAARCKIVAHNPMYMYIYLYTHIYIHIDIHIPVTWLVEKLLMVPNSGS